MMRFTNESDRDFNMVGVQCAAGQTVEIPIRIEADIHKVELLRRNLTEVVDVTVPEPSPIPRDPILPQVMEADPLVVASRDGEQPYEPDLAAAPPEIRERFKGKKRGR